jgi:hypothetical protein
VSRPDTRPEIPVLADKVVKEDDVVELTELDILIPPNFIKTSENEISR